MKFISKIVLLFFVSGLLIYSQVSLANSAAIFGDSGHRAKEQSPFEKAADEITNQLLSRYRDSKGNVSYPDVYNALGSLAGFGCQMSVWDGFIKPGLIPEDKAFVIAQTKDGRKYYFGEFLNMCLANPRKNNVSVWSLVAGAAQESGKNDLPDIEDIATYTTKNVGSKDYGIPRIPKPYRVAEMPIDIVKRDWPHMQKLLLDYKVDPKFWGWTFAIAAQNLIIKDKQNFDAGKAAKIVMEAAWPMSKIDPMNLGGAANSQ